MDHTYKYATDEEYLESKRARALTYYYDHREERLEKDRKYQKERYQKKREEILAKKKLAYQQSKEPKIIVTPNFILEIIR